MVSLSPEGSRRNGYPFDEWSQTAPDTEDLLETPSVGQPEVKFQSLRTPWTIVLLLIVMILQEVSLFLVPHFCETDCGISPFSILIYAHGSLWFLYMVIDRYWRFQHYNSRTSGYLDFYRKTRHIRRIPILVYSGGTALLLILIVLLTDYCPKVDDKPDLCPGIKLSKCNYLQIIVSLELAVIFPVTLLYLVKTLKFNRLKPSPDIHQEELIGSFSRSSALNNGIGFRDETFVDEILEKQADMIRYLKHHNTHLGRKILQLSAQLGNSSS